ncbi:MAG: hypothetical protein Q9182_001857 [Xanthomendoza sp. 2 TL-2023]
MSGTNPFRRREATPITQPPRNGQETAPDAVERAGFRFPPLDTGVQKSSKTKTVRIVSPHYSRSKDTYGVSGISSPPPQSSGDSSPEGAESPSSTEESSPIDPFSARSDEGTPQDDDDDDLRRNTIANASSDTSRTPLNVNLRLESCRKAPALQFGGDASTLDVHDEPSETASTPEARRPHYDVDDFKRLLLTGEKLQTDKTTAATISGPMQGLQIGDSTSNTDASSISRQSFFEPHPDRHPESPRTSIDVPPSDDERHGLVQPSSMSSVGRSRPSVPPSRHGKLVKQNMPQTVSFESLSSSPPGQRSIFSQSTKPLSPTSPKDATDLNKPLPPPPRSESPIHMEIMPVTSKKFPEQFEIPLTPAHHPARVSGKRNPPPMPTARRHGQGRSRSSTNDSSQSASLSEELPQHTEPCSSPTTSSTATSKPPPLPPPRRAATAPGQESSSPDSIMGLGVANKELPPFKPRPPAPPSRTPSMTSVKRNSRISTTSGSSSVAPPPPPVPRRRGSSQSQSSFTPSRLSGEYRMSSNERPRGDSDSSSTRQPVVSESQIEGKDLVGDLAALQREVDELREKFGR